MGHHEDVLTGELKEIVANVFKSHRTMRNIRFLVKTTVCLLLLPVRAERREREHRHADGGELDNGDEFARRLAEHPLLEQVAGGVHRHAGDQQQQVSHRQAGDEDVGHAPHGAVGDEDLHQGDVSQQTHGDDQDVHRGHDAAHDEVHRLPAVRGCWPPGLLRGVGA